MEQKTQYVVIILVLVVAAFFGFYSYTGNAVYYSCNDPDASASMVVVGGNNYTGSIFTQSTVTSGTLSETDSCASTGNVLEFYCSPGSLGRRVLSEKFECPQGYSCQEGACVAPPAN